MAFETQVHTGMTVRSADGDKLGKVQDVRGETFLVEKGFFFPKDYTASMSQIQEISDDTIYLKWGTKMVETEYDTVYGAGSYQTETASGEWRDYTPGRPTGEEKTISAAEERVDVESKGLREVGRVRVHKDVKTEDVHFSVPLRREEVRIEREPGRGSEAGGSASFREEDVSIPIREETIEVTKRPVETERVHLSKEEQTRQQPVSEEVRKEEIEIREEGRP